MSSVPYIETVVRKFPNIKIYINISDDEVLAMLMPKDINVERIEMMLTDEGDGEGGTRAFSEYFTSKWFPLGQSDSMDGALRLVNLKVSSVDPERLDDYVMVITSHWQNIEDNFKSNVPESFDDAVSYEKQLQAELARHSRG